MSVSAFKKSLLIVVTAALSAGGLVGCADQLVYTQDARKQGFAFYQDADYSNAIATLQNVVSQDPRDYEAYYVLGESYQANGAHEQAIGAFRTCLDVLPLTVKGQEDLAMKYKAMDKLAAAISDSPSYDSEITAMEKKCDGKASADDWWMLAKVYAKHGSADEAVESYNTAVLIDSDRFDLTKEAGLYEAAEHQTDRAVFTLKKAYDVNPNDDRVNDALHSLGVFPGLGARPMARI
jgi:cytochrome c-type biogenesis protein CcmH/NrfG